MSFASTQLGQATEDPWLELTERRAPKMSAIFLLAVERKLVVRCSLPHHEGCHFFFKTRKIVSDTYG